jgi:hypothetical protein
MSDVLVDDNEIAKIAEKYNSRRPKVLIAQDDPELPNALLADVRLTVRARILEAAVTQSIAAHRGAVQFTATDMERMEEAERQIFAVGT